MPQILEIAIIYDKNKVYDFNIIENIYDTNEYNNQSVVGNKQINYSTIVEGNNIQEKMYVAISIEPNDDKLNFKRLKIKTVLKNNYKDILNNQINLLNKAIKKLH